MVLFLSQKDVKDIVDMKEAINIVESAFSELYRGEVVMPVRTAINTEDGVTLIMPALLKEMKALGTKIVTVYKNNPKIGLPTILAIVVLNDPRTGAPLAIMDGAYLTAVRTGAVSGVATKYLANPDSKIVGMIGAGVQARTQLWAVSEVIKIENVKIYDTIENSAKSFVRDMSKKFDFDIQIVNTPREAVENSDVIITSSTSKNPVLDGNWLKEGAHINAIGSHTPDAREIDDITIKNSKIVVDSKEAILKECGDILIPIKNKVIKKEDIYAELGEVVIGKKRRKNPSEITLFKSVGLAIQDVSMAKLVYEKALRKNVGEEIEL